MPSIRCLSCRFVFVFALFVSTQSISRPVKITGTTVGPGLVIKKGKERISCPEEHPHAYDYGRYCCKYTYWSSDPSRTLDIYDSMDSCSESNRKKCPGAEQICKSTGVSEVKILCPTSHPYPLANGAVCCSTHLHATDQGQIIRDTDSVDKCPAARRLTCPGLPHNRCKIPPAVDGGFSEWSAWSSCPVTCGGGNLTRTRTCTNPAPKYLGQECVGASSEFQACATGVCPVWGPWGAWSECSVTCDSGTLTRQRECSHEGLCVPSNGDTETTSCSARVACVCVSSSTCPILTSWFASGLVAFAFGVNNKNEGYYPSGGSFTAAAFNFYGNPYHPRYKTAQTFLLNDYCSSTVLGHYDFLMPSASISSFTMSTWLRGNVAEAMNMDHCPFIANNRGSWTNGFKLCVSFYKLKLIIYNNNSPQEVLSSTTLLTDFEWCHVGVTYNSANGAVTFFLNGASQSGGTSLVGYSTTVSSIWPAMVWPDPTDFVWASAELYNRVLSNAEMLAIYNRVNNEIDCP